MMYLKLTRKLYCDMAMLTDITNIYVEGAQNTIAGTVVVRMWQLLYGTWLPALKAYTALLFEL